MLENLQSQVNGHVETLDQRLSYIETCLERIAENTESTDVRTVRKRRSVPLVRSKPVEAESVPNTAELRNETPNGWNVRWVSAYVEGGFTVQVWRDSTTASGFLGEVTGALRTEWYVPPGGVIFVTSTAKIKIDGFVNLEVEEIGPPENAGLAATGHTGERVDTPRTEPLPNNPKPY